VSSPDFSGIPVADSGDYFAGAARGVGEFVKILVADRNRNVRELLRRELRAEGYAVEVARDGREVWLSIKSDHPPHLLILDLEIPYLEDLLEKARFREDGISLPLIIFSFLPDEGETPSVPNAAAFLEKKADMDRLKAVVAEVIGKFYPGPAAEKPPSS
jgi:two-component system, OmpR family, response regulator MprA